MSVELIDVGYRYTTASGDVDALSGVNLTINEGTTTAIVGRSGSGKSTLVSLFSLMRRPTHGTLKLWGDDTSTSTDSELAALRNQAVGVVFQSFHLDPSVSAIENIMLPYYFQIEKTRREIAASAREKLELVGLPDLAKRKPGEMSGGQRQRVAIARALVMNPKVLVADEPTGNLDEETASVIAACLYALPNELGSTVIVVTHDPEIAALAAQTVTIQAGKISQASIA